MTLSDSGVLNSLSGSNYILEGTNHTSSSTIYIAQASSSTGTLNIGADVLSAADSPGYLHAERVVFGEGTGEIVFNHTDANYLFDLSLVGNGTINFLAGGTILSGDNSNFTGAISGSAGATITSGITNIAGDSSAFSGTTDVTGGILRVNGSLGGITTISGTGRLQGNATLDDLIVDTGGSAAPGNSIGTVSAVNVTFNPGSTYEVEVNAARQSDLIDASGTATLNGGTVIGILYPDVSIGHAYTILTAAGGVAGTFNGSSDSYAFLDTLLSYDANNVYLTFSANNAAIGLSAQTRNQRAVANVIDVTATNPAQIALLLAEDAQDLRAGLDRLSGEIHASTSGALMEEQASLQNAAYAPDLAIERGHGRAWIKTIGSMTKTEATANTAGLETRSGGILTGIERRDDQTHAGFGIGTSRTRIEADARGSKADADSYYAIAYAGTNLEDSANIKGSIGYGYHDIGTRRDIELTGFNGQSGADYHAHGISAAIEINREYQAGHGTRLAPYGEIAYRYLKTSSFNENGEAGLHSDGDESGIVTGTLGLRASKEIAVQSTPVTIGGHIGYRHAAGDTDPISTLAFNDGNGSSFEVRGAPIPRDAALIGLSAQVNIQDDLDLSLGYNASIAQDAASQAVAARFNWRF